MKNSLNNLVDVINIWANIILDESNRGLEQSNKIRFSKYREKFQYKVSELKYKEEVNNQNYETNTLYFYIDDFSQKAKGQPKVFSSPPINQAIITYPFAGKEHTVDIKSMIEEMKSQLIEQINLSKQTVTFNFGKTTDAADLKTSYAGEISESKRTQQTQQNNTKQEMNMNLSFTSDIDQYILRGSIDNTFQDFFLDNFILKGKIYIYFDNSHQIKYENGLFKKTNTFFERTLSFNRIEVSIVDIFRRLINEPIIASTFRERENWSFDERTNQISYHGLIRQLILRSAHLNALPGKTKDFRNANIELIKPTTSYSSYLPNFLNSPFQTDWNQLINQKWPQARRNEKLSQITRCDIVTFAKIWNPYAKDRIYQKDSATDVLRNAIMDIHNNKELNGEHKDELIAKEILKYMKQPHNLRFRHLLFEKIDDLINVSKKLNDEAAIGNNHGFNLHG